MSDDERTERHFYGYPPGTVTLGKPVDGADGATVWPFTFLAPGTYTMNASEVVIREGWVYEAEPVATPTVVENTQ